MKESKQFQCLRCEHRYVVEYDPKEVVERACPKCGSNSVRPETAKKPSSSTKKPDAARR